MYRDGWVKGGLSSVGCEMEDKKWASPLWSRLFFPNKAEEDTEVDATDRKKVHKSLSFVASPSASRVQDRGVHKRNLLAYDNFTSYKTSLYDAVVTICVTKFFYYTSHKVFIVLSSNSHNNSGCFPKHR
jgi:hypothetical protein